MHNARLPEFMFVLHRRAGLRLIWLLLNRWKSVALGGLMVLSALGTARWSACSRVWSFLADERPVASGASSDQVNAVAASVIAPVLDLPAEELAAMTRRLRPWQGMSVSGLVHALHLFGPGLTTPAGVLDDAPNPVLDVLLDVPRAAKLFGGARILAPTRYGIRAPLYEENLMGANQAGAMAHRGQFLSVLGSLGVPGDRNVRLADGSVHRVFGIRDDLTANFSLEGEIAWDAAALSCYADGPQWVNKFGRVFNFDELARELNSRDPREAACGGAHDLIALAIIAKVDQKKPILSASARQEASANMLRRVAQVTAAQLADGSWDLSWCRDNPVGPAADRGRSSPPTSADALIVTGHLVEWLLLVPPSSRPNPDIYRRAALWLAAALKATSDEPAIVDKLYCPLIHATRSLRLLSRAVESPGG
jgi:hypothetical protein